MSRDKLALDAEAQRLFEQFNGMESWKEQARSGRGGDRLAQSLLAEQVRLDNTRILLIQLSFLLGRYLADDSLAHNEALEAGVFKKVAAVLEKLSRIAGHLGCAFIRFRGNPADPQMPEKYDYEVVIGNTAVDTHMAPRVARRKGADGARLPDQLIEAFTNFADYGVNNIFIQIPEHLERHLGSLRLSLKILSGFRSARHTGSPITISDQGRRIDVAVINDENMYPDPNLTLIAGINKVGARAMEVLVEKVDVWMRRKGKGRSGHKYTGVYNAALEQPKIRAKLKKPMVELNNIKWLISEAEDEVVSVEKAYIARLAMDTAGTAPQKVVKMIKSVYGDDYARIDKALLGERLNLSSDLLSAAENQDRQVDLKGEVLGNLNQRLDQVKDHVIDDVQVREDTGAPNPDGQSDSDVVHSKVYEMVNFYKGRSVTRKKMVGMVHRDVDFKQRDYQILAKDYRIDLDDARSLVEKLKTCFSDGGRFQKRVFMEAIGHFKAYEQKIFGFLWHHLKDAIVPEDRVAFLNALQDLTARMHQPKQAFKILLEDICADPEKVQFSDNKAVMLTNLIVHRPDKALADYEITPEDIVLNRHNIDKMVAQYASWRIDKDREKFFTKVKTIHNQLAEALLLGQTRGQGIPAPVLLNLERELYIFLSLVPCDTGKAILRSAVQEYGDPQAEVYHQKESAELGGGILQNLRVALRGVGAVGSSRDIAMLEAVKSHNEDFQRLKNDRQFRNLARLVTDWADEAIKIIRFHT